MKTIKSIIQRFVKRTLLSILIIHLSMLSFAATYYVSNAGNDSNSGLTTSLPWQTLAKVNAATFVSGDQILFERGSTFYGTLTVKNSGSAESPITYGAYGTGANPIITGFTTVTAWTNLGSNIWESTNAVSTLATCNLVSINGVNTAMGRYPNADATNGGYLTFQTHSGKTSITSSSLTGTPDWSGAEVVIRSSSWTLDRSIISSQSTSSINFSTITYEPPNLYGFFIQNDSRTLDNQNEWYYNSTTKKLKVYSTSQPVNVKVASVENLATIDGDYITVDGVDFLGANSYLIYTASTTVDHTVIQNCTVSFAGITAIKYRSNYFNILNNTISEANGSGLDVGYSKHIVISGNAINNINQFQGMGQSGNNNHFAYGGYGTLAVNIHNNIISNIGGAVIECYGDSITVKNNFIDTFCSVIDDGSGIYTYVGSQTPTTFIKIEGNIVINGIGAYKGTTYTSTQCQANGIYLDDNTQNAEVFNNTCANNNGRGFYLHNTQKVNVHDNISYNNAVSQMLINHNGTGNMILNTTVKNNTLISKSLNQWVIWLSTTENTLAEFGMINSNYYARPIDDNITIRTNQPSTGNVYRSLAQWQTFSGQDVNSHQSPQAITSENDLQFEYNENKVAKTVLLSQPMIDVKGTKYIGSVTLLPFTSIVLMKDNIPAKYFTEYKSICEGNNYNNWTTTGKYDRTLKTKTGADSIVTTYLTVNPKYILSENINIKSGENYHGWTISGQYIRTLSSISGCDSVVTTNLSVEKPLLKQGSIPVHYSTVWQGENGQNHMNFMVISTILENLPLSADDEIAVFSGSACVGAKMLTKTINVTDSTTFLTFQASQDDGSNNGFVINDTITFKIWDNKNQKEMIAKAITYRNDVLSWLTSGKFAAGATSVVEIVSYIENTQSIELKKGYNMISTFVTAKNPNVSSVTQTLYDEGNLIKMQDEAGNSFENWGSFGGWINNVGSVEKTEGYKLKVANNCILNVIGRPVALPLDIPLKTGWNIISFPHSDVIDAMNVIQSLIDLNKLVKVQDEIGNSIENWGIFGGWKNGIGNFIPGKAYKVKMNADAILTIQQNYTKSAVIFAGTEKTVYFSTGIEGNGTDHMNINLVGLHEAGILPGDELAAYDGEICVGTLKVTENHLINGSAGLIASFSTDDQNRDGFIVGDMIKISAWNPLTGNVSQVQVEVVNGQMKYELNASVLAKMKSMSTNVKCFEDNLKIDVFPNPSKGRVTVRFSQLPVAGSNIDILDISGRKVTSRIITGTSEEFDLDLQPAGIYLVKSIIDSKETIQKLIINK